MSGLWAGCCTGGDGRRACRGYRILCTVMVAAGAVVALFFAWNEQDEVAEVGVVIRCCSYWKRLGENLTAVVDVDGVGQLQAGAWSDELVQVAHRATFLPDEGVQEIAAVRTTAHHLAPGVDGSPAAACIARQRTKFVDAPVSPDASIMNVLCRKIG